jgi:hypothetical protein
MKKLLCLSALIVYVFACCPSSATKPPTPVAETVTIQPSTETPLPTDTPTPSPPLAKVTAPTLNVRAGPNTAYTIVGKLSLDDSVEVVGRNAAGDWLQVVYPANSDRRGWIAADYAKLTGPLETLPEVSAPPPPSPSPAPRQPQTPTPALALTPSPLPTNERAFMDCLACAQQPGWLTSFQSEPGPGAGTKANGLRHGDEVTIIEAERHGEEWWYFVEGTYIYGGSDTTVSGWVPETVMTVETPQPYPPGNAWVECAVLAEQGWGDVPVWEHPGPSISMAVGKIWHGTQVEIIISQWDAEHGIWSYEVTGTDYKTGETVTGWMDGVFLVLTPP